MTDQLSKPAKAALLPAIAVTHVKVVVLSARRCCMVPLISLWRILSYNLCPKRFVALCAATKMQPAKASDYHPQPNDKTERSNTTLLATFWHHINEHRKNWDTWVQLLAYGWNTQVRCTTETTLICLEQCGERSGALNSRKTNFIEECSVMESSQTELNALKNLRLLDRQLEKDSLKARKTYEL